MPIIETKGISTVKGALADIPNPEGGFTLLIGVVRFLLEN